MYILILFVFLGEIPWEMLRALVQGHSLRGLLLGNNKFTVDTRLQSEFKLAVLRKLIEQACEACDVTPFGSSRLVWYRDRHCQHGRQRGQCKEC
jgi:hypothetical protein